MAITTSDLKQALYQRDGETLKKVLVETIGEQVKLDTEDTGLVKGNVQEELEDIRATMGNLLASADAMQFKGVLSSADEVPSADYEAGWTYKIAVAGTYAGQVCEPGDLLIVAKDYEADPEDGDPIDHSDDFVVVQTNIDGAVTGPASATDGNVALFDGATGKVIKNSTLSAAELAKDWVQYAAAMPETMPENLKDGGLLVVGA